jgi:hypothetical protein
VIIKPGTDPEQAAKIRASINKLHQEIEDFLTLSDTIESENPTGDAWKAVWGHENPAFDENTKESHELKASIAKMHGMDIGAQKQIEAE